MSRYSIKDHKDLNLDLSAGFDLVLVPHGTADPDTVVGKVRPGSRGVLVNATGVQRAKRWFRYHAQGPASEAAALIVHLDASTVGSDLRSFKRHGTISEAKQKALLSKLGKSLGLLERRQKAFRNDLRAEVLKGQEMLKDAIG